MQMNVLMEMGMEMRVPSCFLYSTCNLQVASGVCRCLEKRRRAHPKLSQNSVFRFGFLTFDLAVPDEIRVDGGAEGRTVSSIIAHDIGARREV